MLRPTQAVGLLGAVERGGAAVRPGEHPLRRLKHRAEVRWGDGEDAGGSVAVLEPGREHGRPRVVGGRGDEGTVASGQCARLRDRELGAGARLSESAAGEKEPERPIDPLDRRAARTGRELLRSRPE